MYYSKERFAQEFHATPAQSTLEALNYGEDMARLAFNHNYIGTEHILAGLSIREKEQLRMSGAPGVLLSLGIDAVKVRDGIEFIVGRGERVVTGQIDLTPRARRVIRLGVDEAREYQHPEVAESHLLLGLALEDGGIANSILGFYGVGPNQMTKALEAVLGKKPRTPDYLDILRVELTRTDLNPQIRSSILGTIRRLTEIAQNSHLQ
jgi:ATP-dependent Clp protease ATP-binding subunit ClpA